MVVPFLSIVWFLDLGSVKSFSNPFLGSFSQDEERTHGMMVTMPSLTERRVHPAAWILNLRSSEVEPSGTDLPGINKNLGTSKTNSWCLTSFCVTKMFLTKMSTLLLRHHLRDPNPKPCVWRPWRMPFLFWIFTNLEKAAAQINVLIF